MLVRELMSTDVVTVSVDGTLDDAVGTLLEHGVGSVVVVDDGVPVGMVTETDAMRAAHERGVPFHDVAIRDLARPPVVTTDPDRTVQSVARTMAGEDVKKVVVSEDMDVVGIITLTDVVWALSDIRKEATDLAEKDWGPSD
jgi:CBS domain-containing protein